MMVCHCMSITDHEIRATVDWMRAADPTTIITPGKVYRALGKKADCGGCLPLFMDTLETCDTFAVPASLRGLRRAVEPATVPKERAHEGRNQSY